MEAGVLDKKRSRTDSGASSDKRQRFSDDTSEIIESEESEALPETSRKKKISNHLILFSNLISRYLKYVRKIKKKVPE